MVSDNRPVEPVGTALRDVGRVLGISYGDVDRIAKLVPETLGITLSEAIEQSPDLRARRANDGSERRLINDPIAKSLPGTVQGPVVRGRQIIPLAIDPLIRKRPHQTTVAEMGIDQR